VEFISFNTYLMDDTQIITNIFKLNKKTVSQEAKYLTFSRINSACL